MVIGGLVPLRVIHSVPTSTVDPMDHLVRLWFEPQIYWARITVVLDVCHCSCAYVGFKIIKKSGVFSVIYDTVHYKTSFD